MCCKKGDGKCDNECNNFECGFDGGDCAQTAMPTSGAPSASPTRVCIGAQELSPPRREDAPSAKADGGAD